MGEPVAHSSDEPEPQTTRFLLQPCVSWRGFALWALVGALDAVVVVGIASIGVLVLPFAVGVTVAAARLAPDARNAVGVMAGFGMIALILAYINAGVFDERALIAVGIMLNLAACAIFAVTKRSFDTSPRPE
jgi:hypothetical protein